MGGGRTEGKVEKWKRKGSGLEHEGEVSSCNYIRNEMNAGETLTEIHYWVASAQAFLKDNAVEAHISE